MRDLSGHGSDRRPPAPGSRHAGGPARHGTNGHAHHPGPGRPIDPLAVDEDGAVDLVELQADDELINALSSGLGVSGPGQQGYDADDRLVAMLAAWKADVDAEPMPPLVEPDVAAGLLAPPRQTGRRRRVSYLRPVAAAVAVAACGLGVLSIGAYESQPGDTLWGVSKVLYSEHAEQVQAAADVRTGIEHVNQKLASGDTLGAQRDLDAMAPLLAKVEPGQEQLLLDKQRQFLAAKVAETPPGIPTDPSAPLRDGTRSPLPEGRPDPGTAPQPKPPAGPSAGTPGQGSTPGTGGSPDPRVAPAPEGTAPGSGETVPTTAPSTPPEQTSPTTEGSIDPTPTTRPTASGDTSTPNGGVSSTPS